MGANFKDGYLTPFSFRGKGAINKNKIHMEYFIQLNSEKIYFKKTWTNGLSSTNGRSPFYN